ATATITLGNLNQTYDGNPKSATATTTPPGLSGVSISYSKNGTPVASPTTAGNYDVVASLTNANYQANNATGTLVINPTGSSATPTTPAAPTASPTASPRRARRSPSTHTPRRVRLTTRASRWPQRPRPACLSPSAAPARARMSARPSR